ncbi:MAG: PLDc N-terminal domain-containing protein [Actinomycetota bacterium]|nr:PLDc N-terminal domain-containing protein [Actinomycetota bacterium]
MNIELIVLLVIVIAILLPVAGVLDAALTPDSEWKDANQNKIVWIIVQIFLGIFGAIVYFVAVRPQLKSARLHAHDENTRS